MALPTTYMKFHILSAEKQSISGSQNHLYFTSLVFSFSGSWKQSEVMKSETLKKKKIYIYRQLSYILFFGELLIMFIFKSLSCTLKVSKTGRKKNICSPYWTGQLGKHDSKWDLLVSAPNPAHLCPHCSSAPSTDVAVGTKGRGRPDKTGRTQKSALFWCLLSKLINIGKKRIAGTKTLA